MSQDELQHNSVDSLFAKVSSLIEGARSHIYNTVSVTEVYTKYEIGRYIVEEEQHGMNRAGYGKQLLIALSSRLTNKFGKGWGAENLRLIRNFYLIYSKSKIQNSVLEIETDAEENLKTTSVQQQHFTLTWSHYLVLMRVDNPDSRSFYEIECAKQHWSVRQLGRQVGSSLYERLALSCDKDEVMRLACEGQTIEKPSDIIKNPITLEFLGLKPESSYSESKLESAIINKLQLFLLELGKGFLFEARQKRFTFDEQNFFVDLVFYNRLLQCYVLIDLKTDRLSHQDLGQMQMYVNYYDRYVRQEFEKPTIGILLCESKNDALVELTLPDDSNIYASQYQLYLPDKSLLQSKLRQWIREFNDDA